MFFEDNLYLPEELALEVFDQACGFVRSIMGMCSKKLYKKRHSLEAPSYLRERKKIHILEVCCKNNYHNLYTYLTSCHDSSLSLRPENNIKTLALRSGSYEICKLMKLPDTSQYHYLALISGNLKCIDLFPNFRPTQQMATCAPTLEALDFLPSLNNPALHSGNCLLESIQRAKSGLPKEEWFQDKAYLIGWTNLITHKDTLDNFEEFVVEWYRLFHFNTTAERMFDLGFSLKSEKIIDCLGKLTLTREQKQKCLLVNFLYPLEKNGILDWNEASAKMISELYSFDRDVILEKIIENDNVELFKLYVLKFIVSVPIVAELVSVHNAYNITKYLLTSHFLEYSEAITDYAFSRGRVSLCKLCLCYEKYKDSVHPEIQKLVELYKNR